MSTIQARCPSCGSAVRLEPDALLLFAADGATAGTYLFCCDGCEQVTAKPAGPSDLILLAAAGVHDHCQGPPTVQRPGIGRPFTPDDVIDFRRLLAGDGWLPRLLAGAYGSCT